MVSSPEYEACVDDPKPRRAPPRGDMTESALLMLAHGSRDAEARAEYVRIHEALAIRLAPRTVVFAVLEFPDEGALPSIQEGWRRCLATGAERIVALPFFLFPAGHVREDLPAELRAAREAAGWARLDLLPPLGPADEILDTIADRASDALRDRTPGGASDPTSTGLIVVGAGTSDPDANGDLCKASRLLWERFPDRYALVETAWVSLTRPSVPEVIDRCRRLGAERLVVAPYFLNTGVLLKRIDARLAEAREQYPALSIVRAAHFGLHPSLLDLLERRARAALDGDGAGIGLQAVCCRPSCNAVVTGRASLAEAARTP
jgi:sirohydrochlorin cobaltochelatase